MHTCFGGFPPTLVVAPYHIACRILIPQPEIKPQAPTRSTEVQSSNHWTTREFPIPVIIAAFFTKAKRWKQPKCAPVNECIHKMYIHTMKHYSVLKRKKVLIHATACNMDAPWGHCTKWNNAVTKDKVSYDFTYMRYLNKSSLAAQTAEDLPAMQETQIQSLGQQDSLEKEMATHSSGFLPGEFHGQCSLVGYSSWSRKEPDTTKQLTLSLH